MAGARRCEVEMINLLKMINYPTLYQSFKNVYIIVNSGLLRFTGGRGLWQELRGGVDELYWEWMYVNVNLLKAIDVEVIEYCKVV